MFGFIGDIVDTATDIAGDAVETVSLGLIESKDAKRLAKAGLTIAEIASELDLTTIAVKKLLEE